VLTEIFGSKNAIKLICEGQKEHWHQCRVCFCELASEAWSKVLSVEFCFGCWLCCSLQLFPFIRCGYEWASYGLLLFVQEANLHLDKYWTIKWRFECNRWFWLNWFGAWLIIYHVLRETGFFYVLQHACILNLKGFFLCVCVLNIDVVL